jgi:hypothetical protein
MTSLTDRQQRMLRFERHWWTRADVHISELFGCPPEHYRDELAELIALPAALAEDPLLVRRLRRQTSAAAADTNRVQPHRSGSRR